MFPYGFLDRVCLVVGYGLIFYGLFDIRVDMGCMPLKEVQHQPPDNCDESV